MIIKMNVVGYLHNVNCLAGDEGEKVSLGIFPPPPPILFKYMKFYLNLPKFFPTLSPKKQL